MKAMWRVGGEVPGAMLVTIIWLVLTLAAAILLGSASADAAPLGP